MGHLIKLLDRQRKREFFKHYKSEKWHHLNKKYVELLKHKKMSYSKNIVNDLKTSKPSQWYSKIKRMTNHNREIENFYIEEFSGLESKEQANKFVQFYAKTRNQFEAVQKDEFSEYFESDARQDLADILDTS